MSAMPEYRNEGGGKLTIHPRSALLRRWPAKSDASAALGDLHERLAISTVIYEQHGDAGRTGATRALREVIDYLMDQGLPAPSLLPLFDLAHAVDELDRRVVTPLLTPKKAAGRPPKAPANARDDAFMAVIMECCVRHFRDTEGVHNFLEPAGRLAEKLLRQSSIAPSSTAGRLELLRQEISQPSRDDLARSIFEQSMLDAAAASSPLAYAQKLVESAWVRSAKLSE